ncbi:MAG TPA: aminoglycoside phosphotransferase family protein [Galbitalea sp.]|nr:aminoglycoside phosphotransferase family protein [Galbitalea sp.]
MAIAAADIFIDGALVHTLLRQQHPDLAELDVRLVANGWDNNLYRLGNELAIRLPRRRVAVPLIEHEQRWLPEIATRVTVAIPTPVRVGVPCSEFPWPWTITPWFEGTIASETTFDQHETLAAELAQFVRELHTPAPVDAPENPFRGVPLAARTIAIEDRLASGLVPHPAEVQEAWRKALDAPPWTAGAVWLHGDLHPANILTRDGRLEAVLDFGDLTSGDPAADLATAWLTFDPVGRARFRDALDYDNDTWLRARGWALLLAGAFLANSTDSPAMLAIGTHGIEQVLLDQE